MMQQSDEIPKIIHFTWFSGDAFPEKICKCIDSWKKILPDYEIKLWTMDMARELNIQYVNEALDASKWAFASDVVRAYAIWKYGGIYMDTDVLVLKRFDELLRYSMVFFIERNEKEWETYNPKETIDKEGHCLNSKWFVKGRQIQAAMFMGIKCHPCLKEIVDFYRSRNFIQKDGTPDIEIISPSIYAKVLEKYGFLYKDKEQHFGDIFILPSSYVALSKYECGKKTIAVHLGEHAWDPRSTWNEFKHRIRMGPFGVILFKILKLLKI
jgi:mannosyltransferase OCH1-like enzyme